MTSAVNPSGLHRCSNGTTEAARADETVAHGRAHLDYQRRIATEGNHRQHARVVSDREAQNAAWLNLANGLARRDAFHTPKDAA